MKQVFVAIFLFILSSHETLASEALERFLKDLAHAAPSDNTNCFANCARVSAWALGAVTESSTHFGTLALLTSLSQRPAMPTPKDEPRIHMSKVAMFIPEFVRAHDNDTFDLSPLSHCFLIVSDDEEASVCGSWERTHAFSCSTPVSWSQFTARIDDLGERIKEHLRARSQQSYDAITAWFLGEKMPLVEQTLMSQGSYFALINGPSVRFFDNRDDPFLDVYFTHVAQDEPQELFNQLILASYSGKPMFAVQSYQAYSSSIGVFAQ